MRDVVFTSCQRFDRWPTEAMPGQIQYANRYMPVDDFDVGKSCAEITRRTILPRARKDGDIVAAGSCQRAGDLVDVFADAGAGSKGGPVIDHDPHAPETITFTPYPCWSTGWKDILAALSVGAERSQMKIAVVGTGYVGLVLGACLAETGNDVTCIDKDQAKLKQLRRGVMPIYEPGLEEMVRRNQKERPPRLHQRSAKAVREASIVFIAVGTPQHEDGSADLTHVLAVARDIARAMNGYKVIVDKSTVPVGTAARVRESDRPRNRSPLQRRQQSRISQAGRGGRGFSEARPGRDRRGRRSRERR